MILMLRIPCRGHEGEQIVMKNIKSFNAEKYKENRSSGKSDYSKVDEGIYEMKKGKKHIFVTSLSFVQEPKYGEGETSMNISQYPLEDILDKFYCHISDFYEEYNSQNRKECHLEFAADAIDDIRNLRTIIGKHVYNSEVMENDKMIVKLIIK